MIFQLHFFLQAIAEPTASFCMHQDMISSSDKSVVLPLPTPEHGGGGGGQDKGMPLLHSRTNSVLECCGSEGISSSLCFLDVQNVAPTKNPDADPSGDSPKQEQEWKGYACLGVRKALEQSVQRCNVTAPCGAPDHHCMQVGSRQRFFFILSTALTRPRQEIMW